MNNLTAMICLLAFSISGAATTITYQGQLQQGGQPVTGTPGMIFRLYDSLAEGTQVGDDVAFSGVTVEDSLFQVELDFGAGAFDGNERYLEIEVSGAILDPRQKITSAPTAQHALRVAAGAIGRAQIAPGAVGSNELEIDSLSISSGTGLQGGGEIALGSSTTIGIADGGVDTDQIAAGAVGSAQIATGAVGSTQIAPGAVAAAQADRDQIQLRITGTCSTGTTLVGVNPDGSVACAALPIGLAHLADSVGDAGRYTSIAIRDSGRPIISYDRNENLMVFDCANVACSSGTVRTLENNQYSWTHTSIAIRDDGLPIISYHGDGDLKAIDCANAECSSGIARILDSDGLFGVVGEYTSIAIRDNGHPIISYFDASNLNLKVFDCANAACSTGTARTLDSDGNVGFYTSISIRDNGHPIISYTGDSNLKVFDCANAACSTGTARNLDSGLHSSIAIRDNGQPIISYREGSGNLMVYDCANTACSTGTPRYLDNDAWYASIVIRDNGLPIIGYFDNTNQNLKVFDCANATCSSGTARTLDGQGNVGHYIAIALRDDGHPIISYYDFDHANLKVFSCGDSQCAR